MRAKDIAVGACFRKPKWKLVWLRLADSTAAGLQLPFPSNRVYGVSVRGTLVSTRKGTKVMPMPLASLLVDEADDGRG